MRPEHYLVLISHWFCLPLVNPDRSLTLKLLVTRLRSAVIAVERAVTGSILSTSSSFCLFNIAKVSASLNQLQFTKITSKSDILFSKSIGDHIKHRRIQLAELHRLLYSRMVDENRRLQLAFEEHVSAEWDNANRHRQRRKVEI